jgi:hypothetical protein
MDNEEIHSETKSSNLDKSLRQDDLKMMKKKLKVLKLAIKDEKISN